MDFADRISQAVQGGDSKQVVQLVEAALKNDIPATDILDKGLVPGVQALGVRFKEGEVFLPEILVSIRAMNQGLSILKPLFTGKEINKLGTIVLGTVEGDIHDIGKNLVKLMLESSGFRVIDLGVNVPANSFVESARESNADIVAISALLTVTMTGIAGVIGALRGAGMRDKVRVMIGGAPVTRQFADSVGAEGFAGDCVSAVDEAKRLMQIG